MKKAFIVFDIVNRKMTGYTDLKSAVEYMQEDYSKFRRIIDEDVVYTGRYFIGPANIEKSNRGGTGFK